MYQTTRIFKLYPVVPITQKPRLKTFFHASVIILYISQMGALNRCIKIIEDTRKHNLYQAKLMTGKCKPAIICTDDAKRHVNKVRRFYINLFTGVAFCPVAFCLAGLLSGLRTPPQCTGSSHYRIEGDAPIISSYYLWESCVRRFHVSAFWTATTNSR